MAKDLFKFKQFTIQQKASAMKIGVDSILIGSWADVDKAEQAIDLGTGTGVLALMLAQRKPDLQVLAVEIDQASAFEAAYNVKQSPWAERVRVVQADFREFSLKSQVDLIISNPPYFSTGKGDTSPLPRRAVGRHHLYLDFHTMLKKSSRLLNNEGRFSLILPADELPEFLTVCSVTGFFLRRCTRVSSLPGRKAHRCMIELAKKPGPCVENSLMIEKKHHFYTKEMIKLTKAFYLNL